MQQSALCKLAQFERTAEVKPAQLLARLVFNLPVDNELLISKSLNGYSKARQERYSYVLPVASCLTRTLRRSSTCN